MSFHRHEALQLLKPVLHDDHVRGRAAVSVRLAAPDDDKSAVGADVVRACSGNQEHWVFEQQFRPAGRGGRPRGDGDDKHPLPRKAAEEQLSAVTRPDGDTAAIRRDLLPISEFRIPLDVDLRSTRHGRLVGDPAPVWRDGGVFLTLAQAFWRRTAG